METRAGGVSGLGRTAWADDEVITPDPTTGRGFVTRPMLALAERLMARGWPVRCWGSRPHNPTSDHPRGRACDVLTSKPGVLPTAAEKARADALAAELQAGAESTGIRYLVWYGRIWSVERADEGWRPYGGGGVYDPADVTGGHFDHIHISIR
ncbi:hypothetical protein [Krasilnikovia sp. MM14-A1004]|uniref:hypothetical protein n=1 Tax=Krasilnikovia sp. MM14-A1004 TaxID=3373541 RepID=UPI00399D4B48